MIICGVASRMFRWDNETFCRSALSGFKNSLKSSSLFFLFFLLLLRGPGSGGGGGGGKVPNRNKQIKEGKENF